MDERITALKTALKTVFAALIISLLAISLFGCGAKSTTSTGSGQKNTSPGSEAGRVDTDKSSTAKANPQDKSTQATSDKTIALTLYFADGDGEALVAEVRQVPGTSSIAKTVVQELINGPKEVGNGRTIPEETKLLNLDIINKVAYVNFSRDFVEKHWGGSTGELMTAYSIVNTLTELEGIQKVQIMVEGKKIETIVGHLDTSRPIARDESMIKK